MINTRGIYHIAQNFGGQNLGGSIHPDILAKKSLADGDNKSLLLVFTELIFMWWFHGDDVYLNFFKLNWWFMATTNTKLPGIIHLLEKIY